jgi:uncharacterized DUF497 family protein
LGKTVYSVDDRFEWDEEKDAKNIINHGFSLAEITDVFSDPDFIERYDSKHSTEEDRYIGFGTVNNTVFAVSFTPRPPRIRLISSRKLRPFEREVYYDQIRKAHS